MTKNDTISRQAAIDALNSINCFGWVEDSWAKVSGIIEHLPSAQPEIIRCPDCIKADLCAWRREGAEYCSYAERRTDG